MGVDNLEDGRSSLLSGPVTNLTWELYWVILTSCPSASHIHWYNMSAMTLQSCWRKNLASLETIAWISEAPSCSLKCNKRISKCKTTGAELGQ